MEEGETSTPFWLQPPANRRRSRFNSGVLFFTLCLILSLFILFIIPPLLSLSPQIPKPNLTKSSWESVNIVIVLVALLFGFFRRIRNPESMSTVGSTAGKARKSDESTSAVWYENSNPTAVIDDQIDSNFGFFSRTPNQESISLVGSTGSKFQNENSDPVAGIDGQTGTETGYEVKKSNGSMPRVWYEDSNPTAVVVDQNGVSNVQKSVESTVKGCYSYPNQTVVIDDQNGSKIRNESNNVQKSDESTARKLPMYSNPTAVVGSRDRWHFHDDRPLAPEVNRADGASHIRKSQSPHLERVNREVNAVNTGTVLSVSNDIARIQLLDEVSVGEIVEFVNGIVGIVINWESRDTLRVQLMGDSLMIGEGSCVKATGKIASKGSVVNELANPINDRDEISRSESRVTEDRERNKITENHVLPPVRRRKRRRARNIVKRALDSTKINTGTVLGVAFGIARIHCIEEVAAGEIIEFNEGTIGIALNSEYILLMGNGLMIQEGSCVIATGNIAQMPVSEAWLSGFLSALAKPIENIDEIFASESQLNEENEMEQMDGNLAPPGMVNKGKSSEEMNGYTPKMTHDSATINNIQSLDNENLESLTCESIVSEEEAKEDSDDELESESKEYESSPSPIKGQDPPLSPTYSIKIEKKRGGNVTRDILSSLGMKKKKQRQKSVESVDSSFESQPPSPPPPSASIQNFFSLKKGKAKRVISVPPSPPPPPPYVSTSHEQKSVAVEAPDIMRKPPLPVKVRHFVEVTASTSGADSSVTGAESPLHPIPPPPPPPPFQMPGWKFVVKGDYVKIASANTSRSVSPERDDVDTPRNSNYSGEVAVGSSMFCPSPDVNSKADMFIANFRAGLKLQKMNSIKQKQGVGLSNLGPVEPNQAKA